MNVPRYEYSRSKIKDRIEYLKKLSAPYGLVIRYAVKANPYSEIIQMIREADVHFDASSGYEAAELLKQGVEGSKISLSSQQLPDNLAELLDAGVLFVATSLNQLKTFIEIKTHPPAVGVRINPAIGSGHTNRTTTGGINASFGIWHEYVPEILELARSYGVAIDRLHIHIGSGADPAVWGKVMDTSLLITEKMENVASLDIGGGFKIHRYGDEEETDMEKVLAVFGEKLGSFYKRTGRELCLEIEPGTFFIAHAGVLVAHVDDIVDTGKNGHTFLRLNTGMNDFLRGTLYGAQHLIEVVNASNELREYVVVGHNCESGDILTPVHGKPEKIERRLLNRAEIGDEVRIYDTGAYCASMRAKGYNSFPDATEVMVE
ncbi:MAG: diaminopimelate decarboxylase [Minisyncoccia bacterium]